MGVNSHWMCLPNRDNSCEKPGLHSAKALSSFFLPFDFPLQDYKFLKRGHVLGVVCFTSIDE